MTKEVKIMLIIAVLVIAGGIALFVTTGRNAAQPGESVDTQSLVRDTSHMTGDKNAKITLVEFGDFQCPACAYFEPQVQAILDAYKDNKDFNFVFRNFPLTMHANAKIAAEAAEAAGAQGKYWEMHNKLYAGQSDWSESTTPIDVFVKYAQDLGLNVDQFKGDVQSNKFAEIISTDMKDGDKLSVNSTPTFYLNGQKLDQLPTLKDFQTKVTELLNK